MNRIVFSAFLTVVMVTTSPNIWADVSEAAFIAHGSDVYEPVPVEKVAVFVYKPEFKFKIIGTIEARGMAELPPESLLDQLDIFGKLINAPTKPMGEKDDIALAIKALKEEAAKAGASGVIILSSRQVRVSQNSTERQIKGAVILRIP